MDDTKNPLASLGVWGAVFAIALQLAPVLGKQLFNLEPTDSTAVLDQIGTVIAGVVALYGRLKATHVLKF